MNLLKALAAISSLTLLSRILALVRDILIFRAFDVGLTDSFFVAFRLPNLLRRLFAEGAFSQAFVPILGEYKNRKGHDETRLLVDHVVSLLAVILFIITLIGVLAAPVIVYLTAPGFAHNQDKFELTVSLLRFTAPYIFFISLVAVAAGILNTYGKFSVPAVAPVLLNICFIVATIWVAPHLSRPIIALGGAVLLRFARLHPELADRVMGVSVPLRGAAVNNRLLNGSPADVLREANRCFADGLDLLSSGCAVPPLTKLENLRAMAAAGETA